jgi:hypothetical protein
MGMDKTTAEMKILSTFTGWDFTNTWAICETTNYPRLQWQSPAIGDFVCPEGVNVEDLGLLSSCWLEFVDLRADISQDGVVNLIDYAWLAKYWLTSNSDADISEDGSVNESDLILLAEQWLLQENTSCRPADLNADGRIDLADYAIFAKHWLEGI